MINIKEYNYIKKNYDISPLVISNNFTSLVFGVVFWLIFNGISIYFIVYSGLIDLSEDKDLFIVMKNEMYNSVRFSSMLILYFIANIGAFYSLFKIFRISKKIMFKNKQIILNRKNFNDIDELNLNEIQVVKKSIYPLLMTGYTDKNIPYYVGHIIAVPFVLLSSFISFVIIVVKLMYDKTFLPLDSFNGIYTYVIIYKNNSNKVINVHISNKKEYIELKQYFSKTLKLDLDLVPTNYKLSNI